jgi:nucleoside 2-deoxyribosyltransferase
VSEPVSLTPEQWLKAVEKIKAAITDHARELAVRALKEAVGQPAPPPQVIYIAGPMNGLTKEQVHERFYGAEAVFKKLGFEVLNPQRMDEEHPVAAVYPPHPELPGEGLREIVRRDTEAISKSDAIALLIGWQFSRGAQAEAGVAKWLGLPAYFQQFDGSFKQVEGGHW